MRPAAGAARLRLRVVCVCAASLAWLESGDQNPQLRQAPKRNPSNNLFAAFPLPPSSLPPPACPLLAHDRHHWAHRCTCTPLRLLGRTKRGHQGGRFFHRWQAQSSTTAPESCLFQASSPPCLAPRLDPPHQPSPQVRATRSRSTALRSITLPVHSVSASALALRLEATTPPPTRLHPHPQLRTCLAHRRLLSLHPHCPRQDAPMRNAGAIRTMPRTKSTTMKTWAIRKGTDSTQTPSHRIMTTSDPCSPNACAQA